MRRTLIRTLAFLTHGRALLIKARAGSVAAHLQYQTASRNSAVI